MRTVRSGLRGRRAPRLLALAAGAGLAVAGCGAPAAGTAGPSTSAHGSTPRAGGTADVAYAGSLANLNETVIGPAFTRATGHPYQGRGAGSLGLSQEIRSGEVTPNVFESVGAAPITALGRRYPGWYIRFAASPLVVAYSPASHDAAQLRAIAAGRRPLADLFTLMAAPGFRLGRTNPNIDPQGAAFAEMLELAQSTLHLPAGTVAEILGGPAGSATSPEVFAETALEPRLQAGQLDAASAFLSQAVQLHLPYVALPASINMGDPAQAAHYATGKVKLANGTTVSGAPLTLDITTIGGTDPQAADAFISYLLSPAGRAELARGGYTLLTPTAFGKTSAIPASIRRELGG